MRKKKSVLLIVVIAIALLLLLLLCFRYFKGRFQEPPPNPRSSEFKIRTLLEKTTPFADSANKDTLSSGKTGTLPKNRPPRTRASARDAQRSADSAARKADSLAAIDTARAGSALCKNDTTPPWVYTDPAGGLHHAALSVKLFGTKPCAIEWKTDSNAAWNAFTGAAIAIDKTITLWLRAKDSCGNAMAPRGEQYELAPEDTVAYCPSDMEHILVGATSFCMDRYEWPNKKGSLPRAYISLYQAMDTCVSAGKRLCTSDEWTIACTGPYGWKYPYGQAYELYACVTNDTMARPSGSRPECRGYFGVFDMSGNLAEWTSTKSSKNTQFYNVRGGFWESGPQSGCFDVRYSYYPQNRHNPVGLRCCADARPQPRNRQHGAD